MEVIRGSASFSQDECVVLQVEIRNGVLAACYSRDERVSVGRRGGSTIKRAGDWIRTGKLANETGICNQLASIVPEKKGQPVTAGCERNQLRPCLGSGTVDCGT